MLASFSTLDWVIVVVYLGVSVAIGLLANRFITGISGYLVAGRSLGTALSIATMTGSELGLITVMYQAQKGYNDGFKALHIGLVAGIVTLMVGLTGFVVVRLRRAKVMTIPEYYEQRFGRRTRILGGVLLALGGILNMGLFLQVGGQFVTAVTGLAPDGMTLKLVMTGLLALVLFYTVLGGMVSVVLTDYVQFVVLSLGLVVMVFFTLDRFGMEHLVEAWQQREGGGDKKEFEAFDPTDKGYAYISWQAVLGFVSCAIWPTAVSRALSARDESVVKRQYTISSISFMIRFLIPCFLGIAAFVFLTEAGAVMTGNGAFTFEGQDFKSIQAMPVMTREILPIGLLGLITAAMLAAFMSTNDSYLLCWSSVIARDVIAQVHPDGANERRQLTWTRVGIVLIGLYVLLFGIGFEPGQDVWEYLGVTGGIYATGAIGVLVAGLYWKRASSMGAVFALVAGFTMILGITDIKQAVGLGAWGGEHIYLGTMALAAIGMVAGSLLFPDRRTEEVAS